MWMKILDVGKKGEMKGRFLTADSAMIDKMAAAYNPRYHEAPVVIGDITDSDPAFGWVKAVQRKGDALYAEAQILDKGIANDIQQGTRRVRKVGFYPRDYSLRHISLSGGKIKIPGLDLTYKEGGAFYEFVEDMGGEKDMDHESAKMKAFLRLGDELNFGVKQKQFSENDNPGEELHRKTMEILMSNPKFDRFGKKLEREFTYSDAFQCACLQYPDLAARYIEQIEEAKKNNSIPAMLR